MTSEYETLFGPSRLRHSAEMADAFIAAKQQASRDVYGLLSQEMRERGVLPDRLPEEQPGQITPINLDLGEVSTEATPYGWPSDPALPGGHQPAPPVFVPEKPYLVAKPPYQTHLEIASPGTVTYRLDGQTGRIGSDNIARGVGYQRFGGSLEFHTQVPQDASLVSATFCFTRRVGRYQVRGPGDTLVACGLTCAMLPQIYAPDNTVTGQGYLTASETTPFHLRTRDRTQSGTFLGPNRFTVRLTALPTKGVDLLKFLFVLDTVAHAPIGYAELNCEYSLDRVELWTS